MRNSCSLLLLLASQVLWLEHLFAAAPPAVSETPRTPQESVKLFQVNDDNLVWEQVLAEPNVAQPVNIKFDDRGRLWVVQYRQYPYPAGVKVLSRDKHWRVQYDSVPKAPPNHQRGRDKITIHEDTNGDGKFDKHKTFVDGLNLATAVEIGRGGVWVLNPPYLLFYADKNRDDVPDGDPEVRLAGFGLSDSHSVVNSLTWGPDGWLYAAQGSTVHGQVVRPGTDDQPVHSLGQLIWRYHPEQRKYEIFAEGGGNAFGVEIDSKGRIFSGHNGGDTRGFHYVQGGYYQKGFSKHGPLSNPYAFGYFEDMPSHPVPRFTHTFVIYEGAALPEKYNGKLFGVEPLQSQIVLSDVIPQGSSFKTNDINRPVTSDDGWFRPVDIKVGPDGAIYVADFYERFPSHREHYEGKVFRDDGRIYRLRAKASKATKGVDLSAMLNDELIKQLRSPNKTVRQLALRVIGDRKDATMVPSLRALLRNDKSELAVECLWAINACGGFDDEVATLSLAHDNEYVRAWAVRLLCDDHTISDDISNRLAALSQSESSNQVRTQLASSARRLPASQGLPIVRTLLKRDEDIDDVFQPLLLWWAIETHCESETDAVLELFHDTKLWDRPLVKSQITSRLMRRFAAPGTRKDYLVCTRLFKMAPTEEHQATLLEGFEQAMKGRSLAGLPDTLARQINNLGGGSLVLRVRGGSEEAIAEALKTIAGENTDVAPRQELIEVFAEIHNDDAVAVLVTVANSSKHQALRVAALSTLQSYPSPEVGAAALELLADNATPANLAAAAIAVLVSRPKWAALLLSAVDEKRIAPATIDTASLRKILLHDNQANAELIKKHWGEISGATTDEMRAQVKLLAAVIRDGSGDPYAGKKTYLTSCAKCHRLFEEGADIGPNLTSYQRDKVEAMLLNVVNPSAEIREGFESYNIFTDDGRVLAGFLADQDQQIIVLRTADGQRHTLRRDEIDEMQPSPQSIMPERLLDGLDQQQVRDLFAYLRSRQPLND